jgi:hypothetical protein
MKNTKHSQVKKLTISRETLAALDTEQLVHVDGGHGGAGHPGTIVCAPAWLQRLEQIRSNMFCGRR